MRSLLKSLVFALALVAGTGLARAETIKVATTAGVHAQVLEEVAKVAAREGLTLKIIEFSDYIMPNEALASGEVDANSFQHMPFLQAQVAARHYDFVPVARTVLFPIGFYSKKYKDIKDVPDRALLALGNDPANEARSLILLESAGLIRLREGAGFNATPRDIIDNPHKFRFVEVEAAQLVRSLDDVAAAAVNANYAIDAKLNPQKDSILLEPPQSQYTCAIVVRAQDKDKPWVKRFAAAYQSPEVKAFIEKTFPGAGFAGW